MKLDEKQMQSQVAYEHSLFYINKLYQEGLLKPAEYKKFLSEIEQKYQPIIKHNSLLYLDLE